MNAPHPAKQLADILVAADEVVKREFGVPVEDFDITLNLDVIARWVKGYPGNRDEPPEPAGYRIERVMCGATDITAIFSEEDMERLAQELLD